MKKSMAVVALGVCAGAACAQQYFQASGGTVDFTKADFANTADPANWDSVTGTVAITRGDSQGIYNPLQESFYTPGSSPSGTLWYFGGTVQDVIEGSLALGQFKSWQEAAGSNPPSTLNTAGVLYLTAENAYVDIVFTQWTGSAGGGGFAYTRAVVPTPMSALPVVLAGAAGLARRRR